MQGNDQTVGGTERSLIETACVSDAPDPLSSLSLVCILSPYSICLISLKFHLPRTAYVFKNFKAGRLLPILLGLALWVISIIGTTTTK